MEADLQNPAPVAGEPNADRTFKPNGEMPDEPLAYGPCDFGAAGGVVKRAESIRGDVAGARLCTAAVWGKKLSAEEKARFEMWHAATRRASGRNNGIGGSRPFRG